MKPIDSIKIEKSRCDKECIKSFLIELNNYELGECKGDFRPN